MSRLKAALILVLLFAVAFSVSAQDDPSTHVVLPGENLFRIAQDYGVDVDALAHANNISNTWLIYAGQKLTIPSATDTSDTSTSQPQQPLVQPTVSVPIATPQPAQYHTVGYGEGLAVIAQKYDMTIEQIAELNHITNPDLIYAGQKLLVSGAPTPTPAPVNNTQPQQPADQPTSAPTLTSDVTHIVQANETLASIGQQYGISWLQIAQANNIYDADHIEVGQELTIPGGSVIQDGDYINASAPPARIGTGKEIIVDLSDQRVFAYEDGKLIRNDLVSTGLPDSPTVLGDFKVQRKYVAQTMTGPGYYLPDVPYVMYFYAGYALHGTYWHHNFGHVMSHGCVNLPTPEAAWFYSWTEIGTPVHVQA